MLDLASHIVKAKAGHFDPSKFEDQYDEALNELLKKKQEGKPIERPERPKPTNVVNLMDALTQSVEASGAATSLARQVLAVHLKKSNTRSQKGHVAAAGACLQLRKALHVNGTESNAEHRSIMRAHKTGWPRPAWKQLYQTCAKIDGYRQLPPRIIWPGGKAPPHEAVCAAHNRAWTRPKPNFSELAKAHPRNFLAGQKRYLRHWPRASSVSEALNAPLQPQ
jgi:hypothetical protein